MALTIATSRNETKKHYAIATIIPHVGSIDQPVFPLLLQAHSP